MNQPAPQNAEPSPPAEPWTVRRILQWTTEHLKKHGSDSPRLETEVLLAHAIGCQRIQLYTRHEETVDDRTRAVMRDFVKRRTQSEPVAYLVGHREFFGLDFQVTPDVLIPRPETETLVLDVIERAKQQAANSISILDLCTGSGCIGVALAKNLPSARVTATDISDPALNIARTNAENHGVADWMNFKSGNLFEAVSGDVKFDYIVSNPPYVTEEEFNTLDSDVRLHEPKSALVAGADGLDLLHAIVDESPRYFSPGGWLLMEMDPAQMPAMLDYASATQCFSEVGAIKDFSGHERVIRARFTG